MPNMSHCRFHNTLRDLVDCIDHMDDELSPEEAEAHNKLLLLCARLASDYAGDIEAIQERNSVLRKKVR